jgi:hypothetical protein
VTKADVAELVDARDLKSLGPFDSIEHPCKKRPARPAEYDLKQVGLQKVFGGTQIVQRDDGMWSIGWHDDAPGPFSSRLFAVAVLAQEARRARVAVSS